MARKRTSKRAPEPTEPPAIGYHDVTHADLGRFVTWMRDRAISADDVRKVLAKLELLKQHGIQWGRPHVRHIEGSLWELKIRGENTHRVYFRHEPPHARCVWYGTKSGQDEDIERAKGIP